MAISTSRRSWNARAAFLVGLAFFMTVVVSLVLWTAYNFASGSRTVMSRERGQHVLDIYDGIPRLRFQSDGTFKISVLEDMHMGEGEDNRGWFAFVHPPRS